MMIVSKMITLDIHKIIAYLLKEENMIFVECPYCNEDINITFGEEIKNLINKGVSDCKCDYCKKNLKFI